MSKLTSFPISLPKRSARTVALSSGEAERLHEPA